MHESSVNTTRWVVQSEMTPFAIEPLGSLMTFKETTIAGVVEVNPELKLDERGFFARTWCQEEFETNGSELRVGAMQHIVQYAQRVPSEACTIRLIPYAEAKLVRCTSGAVYDVVIDLRFHSPTFGKWISGRVDG